MIQEFVEQHRYVMGTIALIVLSIPILIKRIKRVGVVPILLGIAALAGAWYLGGYTAPAREVVVEKPVEVIVEKPVGNHTITEYWEKFRGEQTEKEKLAAKLAEAEKKLAALAPKREKGTRVQLYDGIHTSEPDSTSGICGYCQAHLIISGDKGDDAIRCPNCGGKMPAIKAIMYLNKVIQRGY